MKTPLRLLFAAVLFLVAVEIHAASSAPEKAGRPAPPTGLYLLSDRQLSVERMVLPSYLSGFSLRIAWKDLEPTEGAYDFSAIKRTVEQLQKRDLKLTLEIFASVPPDYVLEKASGTFQVRKGKAPLPWDSVAQARWKAFLNALAVFPIIDTTVNHEVSLRDHPTLTAVDAAVVGLHAIRDIRGDLVKHPTYDRKLFLDAVEASVRASREAFPKDYGFIAFFRMEDDLRNPSLDEAVFKRLQENFMGPAQSGLGLFQELWSDQGPAPQTMGVFLKKVKAPDAVLLQSLTSWKRPFTGAEKVSSGNPAAAFEKAYREYGCRYFELYSADVRSADLTPVFTEWAARLKK